MAVSNAQPKPLRRVPLPVVIIHWLLVGALFVSLMTGMRVAADATSATVSKALSPLLPQGDVLLRHLGSGVLITALSLAYALQQALTGQWRRFLPRSRGPDAACRHRLDLRLGWLLFLLLPIAVVTGLLQYVGGAALPRAPLEAVHRAAAWGLVAYTVLHVATHLAAGGLRRLMGMLLPRRKWFGAGAVSAAAVVVIVLALPALDRRLLPTLEITGTDRPPTLDGRADDPAWSAATPVEVRLSNGANLPGGETRVRLRGLHDGERVYLLCEWLDPTRSQKHVPLVKTADGWRITQTAYRAADENRYYEDKLALMLAPANPLAALASIHLGPRPLNGQPGAPGGRGLHYTTDDGILDIWHWKSVRNGAEHQADDNFFGPPLPAPAQTPRVRDPDSGAWMPRYTAGYRKDPPGTYAGYEMNWENFSEGVAQPLRLPDNPRDVAHLIEADLDPDRSDNGTWWIELNDTRPYADGPDDLPVGTILPSVLPTGRLTGDRGDIRARGHWENGRWSLELSRRLDTGSSKDVPIADGTLVWVAVFDHTQTRHAYHLRPLRIRMAEFPSSPKGNPTARSG